MTTGCARCVPRRPARVARSAPRAEARPCSQIARTSASLRTFFGWPERTGRDFTDFAASSPRRAGTGPCHRFSAGAGQAALLADAYRWQPMTTTRSTCATAQLLELLYATGIRVGELVGLDRRRRRPGQRDVLRVVGKGDKGDVVFLAWRPGSSGRGRGPTRGRPRLVGPRRVGPKVRAPRAPRD